MATTTSMTSLYVGIQAKDLLVEAYKKSDTIDKSAITVLPNVIGTGYLPKLTNTPTLQLATSCGFTPNGTLTYLDKAVATKRLKLEQQYCKNDFHQSFESQEQGLFSASDDIPATIEDAIMSSILGNLSEALDYQIWQGDGTTHSVSGLLAQFVADGDVVDVAGTASTVSNVQAEIAKTYNAIIPEIYDESDLIIAVSNNIARNYKQSQISNYLVGTPVGDKVLDYLGIPLVAISGLPDNKMIAYRVQNICFLTGLEADFNSVRVVDFDAYDLTGNLGTQVIFNGGVGYTFGAEIVYYAV